MLIPADGPDVVRFTAAIQSGDVDVLRAMIAEQPELAAAHFGDDQPGGMARTALHAATDWPANFPNIGETIRILVEAGANVSARLIGAHIETQLHWAATSTT